MGGAASLLLFGHGLEEAPPGASMDPSAFCVATEPAAAECAPSPAATTEPVGGTASTSAPTAHAVAPEPQHEGAERAAEKVAPGPLDLKSCLEGLAWAPNLTERVRILDEVLRRGPTEHALEVLEDLLDSGELPGKFYEATSLRLCILARIGGVPGTKAEALLVDRLAPSRPRPERLLALEMLAARRDSSKDTIGLIARDDHDSVVKDRARWVLAHAQ